MEKGVAEILEEGGVKPKDIKSIIWRFVGLAIKLMIQSAEFHGSHSHFDHTGDPSTFPSSTELVVGPGFKESIMPGYPAEEDSAIRESYYKGREVREIEFHNAGLYLGHFRAMDYFGDGSFYLLDSPGVCKPRISCPPPFFGYMSVEILILWQHAIGHMCGLCRTTTAPDTFVFLGGDCAHNAGEWRPTNYLSLPDEITPSPLPAIRSNACPGALLIPLHRFYHKDATSPDCDADAMRHPFFTVRDEASHDGAETRESVEHMCEFDAHDNIFTMIALDNTMLDAIDSFPKAPANEWKQKGWREKVMWQFLRDFHEAVADHVDNEARR